MATEPGFPPPDDHKNLNALKSELLSSAAVIPPSPETTPHPALTVPEAANDTDATPLEKSQGLKKMVMELHGSGTAEFDKLRNLNPKDFIVRINQYQPKPAPSTIGDLRIHAKEGLVGPKEAPASAEGSRAEKMLGWLKERNEALNVQAEKLGGKKLEQMFRATGEWYNAQNKWAKIGIGLGIGAGAALSLPFSTTLAGAFGVGIAAQRALGGLGRFVTIEKNLQKAKEGTGKKGFVSEMPIYQWLAQQPESVRSGASVALAALYSLGFSSAVGGAVHAVSEEVVPFLEHFWPHAAEHAPAQQHAPEAVKAPVTAPASVASEAAPPAAFDATTISVGASSHGQEGMIKSMWEQLQGKDIPLPQDHDSDLYKLLTADKDTIGAVAHRIALDPKHHFFEMKGGVLKEEWVGQHASMTMDNNGNILFASDEHAAAVEHLDNLNRVRESLGLKPHGMSEVQQTAELNKMGLASNQFDSLPAATDPALSHVGGQDAQYHEAAQTPEVVAPNHATAPVQAPRPLAPLEDMGTIAPHTVPHPIVETAPTPEIPQPAMPAPHIEHAQAFINPNKLPVDPTAGHIFEDAQHTTVAYGNNYDTRLSVAQDYVKAHRDASVWVQAKEPVFYNGAWRPWVFQVKYGGFLRGVQVLIPNGPPDPSHIGAINADTFIKQLDTKA